MVRILQELYLHLFANELLRRTVRAVAIQSKSSRTNRTTGGPCIKRQQVEPEVLASTSAAEALTFAFQI